VLLRSIHVSWPLRVFFTEDVFDPGNPRLREVLADTAPRKVLVVLEDTLALAQPDLTDQVAAYFETCAPQSRLARPPLLVAGGEAVKNSQSIVNDLLSHIHRQGFIIDPTVDCGAGATRGSIDGEPRDRDAG
jgi:hypothetical protein